MENNFIQIDHRCIKSVNCSVEKGLFILIVEWENYNSAMSGKFKKYKSYKGYKMVDEKSIIETADYGIKI